MWVGVVFVAAVGVAVAGDVEPVAPPAFAVVGGFEELVDEVGEGVGGGVGDEGVDLGGCGGEADEVEVGAADEAVFVGGWRGCEGGGSIFARMKWSMGLRGQVSSLVGTVVVESGWNAQWGWGLAPALSVASRMKAGRRIVNVTVAFFWVRWEGKCGEGDGVRGIPWVWIRCIGLCFCRELVESF